MIKIKLPARLSPRAVAKRFFSRYKAGTTVPNTAVVPITIEYPSERPNEEMPRPNNTDPIPQPKPSPKTPAIVDRGTRRYTCNRSGSDSQAASHGNKISPNMPNRNQMFSQCHLTTCFIGYAKVPFKTPPMKQVVKWHWENIWFLFG